VGAAGSFGNFQNQALGAASSSWRAPTSERSRANTFLILGNPTTVLWMSIVSGYLVQAFGWRGMFIIEGAPPIIWAFVWRDMVEDWPHQADWLDPNERVELERKLEDEQRQFKPVKNYGAAFRTPAVIMLAIQYFCWSVGVYGFVIWLPSMLKAAGETSIVLVGWLSAGPYLAAAALMIIGSYFSDVSCQSAPIGPTAQADRRTGSR
jgi:MFS family permease